MREIDDTIDGDAHRIQVGASDAHPVAGRGVKVGRGLLGEEHAGARPRKIPDLARKRGSVGRRDSEYEPRSCGLGCSAGCRGESRGLCEPDGESHLDAGVAAHCIDDRVRIRAGLRLDLPVDGYVGRGPLGHRRLRRRQERANGSEERDGHSDAGRGGGESRGAAPEESYQPRQAEHVRSDREVMCPSAIAHWWVSLSAIRWSWVVTTSAVPASDVALRRTSITADADTWSS